MIRLEWMSGHQSLRIMMLPEEYYCPGLQYVQENATRAEWQTSWKGTLHVERGHYRCKAVHAHRFTEMDLRHLTCSGSQVDDTIRSVHLGDPGRRTSKNRRGFSGTLGRVTMQSVH